MEKLHKPDRITYVAFNPDFRTAVCEEIFDPLDFAFAENVPTVTSGGDTLLKVQSLVDLSALLKVAEKEGRYKGRAEIIEALKSVLEKELLEVSADFGLTVQEARAALGEHDDMLMADTNVEDYQ